MAEAAAEAIAKSDMRCLFGRSTVEWNEYGGGCGCGCGGGQEVEEGQVF